MGRNITRTVGWFTSIYPVHLVLGDKGDIGKTIRVVKEGLRKIPRKGIGYGILKYMRKGVDKLKGSSEICFNYFGQWKEEKEGIFSYGGEGVGENVSKNNISEHGIDINSEIREGKLTVDIASNGERNREDIKKLGEIYIKKLSQVIEYCCREDTYGYTASDFDEIDNESVIKEINRIIG